MNALWLHHSLGSTVRGFDSTRVIDDDFNGAGSPVLFPRLKRLTLYKMPRLEKLSPPSYFETFQQFKELVELTLIHCAKLRKFYATNLSYKQLSVQVWWSNEMLLKPISKFFGRWKLRGINVLQIFGCQELRSLPNDISKMSNLYSFIGNNKL